MPSGAVLFCRFSKKRRLRRGSNFCFFRRGRIFRKPCVQRRLFRCLPFRRIECLFFLRRKAEAHRRIFYKPHGGQPLAGFHRGRLFDPQAIAYAPGFEQGIVLHVIEDFHLPLGDGSGPLPRPLSRSWAQLRRLCLRIVEQYDGL